MILTVFSRSTGSKPANLATHNIRFEFNHFELRRCYFRLLFLNRATTPSPGFVINPPNRHHHFASIDQNHCALMHFCSLRTAALLDKQHMQYFRANIAIHSDSPSIC